MTIETIKSTVDRKINRYLNAECKTINEVIDLLTESKEKFGKMLNADINLSTKTHMIKTYISFLDKRLNDFKYFKDYLSGLQFFAGASDENIFNLIKFRDKVSQDVLESQFV